MFEFSDVLQFEECVRDQQRLMVPFRIKRCIAFEKKGHYPDDPLEPVYEFIDTFADVKEVPANEITSSGGILMEGDNSVWCQEPIRWAKRGEYPHDPLAVADTFFVFGQEWHTVGKPITGQFMDEMVDLGFYFNIRLRTT